MSTCGWRPATVFEPAVTKSHAGTGIATPSSRWRPYFDFHSPSPNSASLSPRPLKTHIHAKHRMALQLRTPRLQSQYRTQGPLVSDEDSMAVWAARDRIENVGHRFARVAPYALRREGLVQRITRTAAFAEIM